MKQCNKCKVKMFDGVKNCGVCGSDNMTQLTPIKKPTYKVNSITINDFANVKGTTNVYKSRMREEATRSKRENEEYDKLTQWKKYNDYKKKKALAQYNDNLKNKKVDKLKAHYLKAQMKAWQAGADRFERADRIERQFRGNG